MDPEDPVPSEPLVSASSPPQSVDPILRRRLRLAADEDGFLGFDRFVEIALYDPGRGFYDRSATRLGRAGDFYTAAHVHRLFGATLAGYLKQLWTSDGSPDRFRVVEVGPGDGTLAADIREALHRSFPACKNWEYLIVERSAALRATIESRLGPSQGGDFPWGFAPSLAALGPIRGVVFANELLDALPFRRFQKTSAGWSELGVSVPSEGPVLSANRPAERVGDLPDLPADASDGAVMEVSSVAEAWIRELADHLARGRALLIDYGEEEGLLLRRGGAGTLEAIRAHRSVDPLSDPGTADLSSWVNFTRLRRVAKTAGFKENYYGPLSEALIRWGIEDARALLETGMDAVESVKLRLAMKSFLLGFRSFKVLELSPPDISL